MHVVIDRIVIVVDEIPTPSVIDVAVPIIIDPISSGIIIRPNIGGEVRMSTIDPRVNNSNQYRNLICNFIPSGRRLDLIQTPLINNLLAQWSHGM